MVEIVRTISKKPHNRPDGKAICVVELRCDTGSELTGISEIDNIVLAFGSVAWAVREGEAYVLDSEGSWYKQSDGTEVDD